MRSKQESLAEFRRVFKTKEDFVDWLWEREGNTCFCGSKVFVYSENRRSRYCERKHRSSVTAATVFRRCRALLAFAMALWLAADGILISACELAKLNNIKVSTAWEILKKVSFLALDLLKSGARTASENFSFIIGRRSIETIRHQHPRSELLSCPGENLDVTSEVERFTRVTLNAIENVHQRVSRKYLQLFAATLVFVHEKLDFIDLLLGALALGPVTRSSILAYVSPQNIDLASVPNE